MLRSLCQLKGYRFHATDGDIGQAADWYLDDEAWVVRYVVVDTGVWFPQQQVLIAPSLLGQPDWESGAIPVRLTRDEIERRPDAAHVRLRSREAGAAGESEAAWPPGKDHQEPFMIGMAGSPPEAVGPLLEVAPRGPTTPAGDALTARPLRSAYHAVGYDVEGKGRGKVGQLEDLLIDDQRWSLDYLVIDVGPGRSTKRVLVAIDWIRETSDAERTIRLGLAEDAIRSSPDFDPAAPANVQMETRRYDYHGRPKGKIGTP